MKRFVIFLQVDILSIFVDIIILLNEVITLKQHQEQEQGAEVGRDQLMCHPFILY